MNNKVTNSSFSLANYFLIAMPSMKDFFFKNSVIYLCEHDANGAMGIVINKPSPLVMDLLFDAAKKPTPDRFQGQPVLMGGPVQMDRGFLVHTPAGSWQNSLLVTNHIALTTSRDIIAGLSNHEAVDKAIATIGFSQWKAGQLEQELAGNHWLTVSADMTVLFDLPYEKRYQFALDLLKINLVNLSSQAGHA